MLKKIEKKRQELEGMKAGMLALVLVGPISSLKRDGVLSIATERLKEHSKRTASASKILRELEEECRRGTICQEKFEKIVEEVNILIDVKSFFA